MGYDSVSFSVSGRVSRHNSARDRADNAAWARLQAEVDALIDSDEDYRRVTERETNAWCPECGGLGVIAPPRPRPLDEAERCATCAGARRVPPTLDRWPVKVPDDHPLGRPR